MAELSPDVLLQTLRERFERNPQRHPGLDWPFVLARLGSAPAKIRSLQEMEASGGEPDVVGMDGDTVLFFDCSAETPKGRRSLCYDAAALESRKEAKPTGSAMGMAQAMGAEMLSESQYLFLQTLGEFDLKTSSWLATPSEVRRLGGAIFGDRRFGRVFVYHNGAESYYASRGFRCCLRA